MNLARILESAALYFPDRPAVVSEDGVQTYGGLHRRAEAAASALIRLGVGPGDRVGLCLPASADWVALYYGVIKIGAAAVTLFHGLTGPELQGLLADARPVVLFLSDDRLEDLGPRDESDDLKTVVSRPGDLTPERFWELGGSGSVPSVERDRHDTAAVLYTGGTTGVPKGVMLSHANIMTSSQNVSWAERSTENDRALCFLPLNHVFGQIHILNSTIYSAGSVILLPGFDLDRVLDAIRRFEVTKFYAAPTIYFRLLGLEGLKEKLGPVRYAFSAAASLARETVLEWKKAAGLDIHESYGMTESAAMATYNHYYRHVVGSVGTPVGLVEVGVRDADGGETPTGQAGEICLRGPNIMRGYLGREAETKAAFFGDWLRTGDVGLMDESRHLYIVDRLKDMIVTGGENVYPREVEEVLHERPEVQECAVVGRPDPEYGERVTAVIVPRPGRSIDGAALKTFLKTRLAGFKVPKEYIEVEELPKNPAGKTLKRELRKNLAKAPE